MCLSNCWIPINKNQIDQKPIQMSDWKSVFFLFASVGGILFFLSGCGGTQSEYIAPVIVLPPHIKSIGISPIKNDTSQTFAENKFYLAVREKFVRDGRVAYIDDLERADASVIITVKHFHETVLVRDVNFIPREYQLWLILDVKLLDRKENRFLWEEPLLEQKFRYAIETEPGGKTPEQAREEIWTRYASDIVKRTLDGFGSVTSVSPRSVPQHDEKLDGKTGKY